MSIPTAFDRCVRFVDQWIASTTRIKKFHGRSLFAFLLPLPIYFFIVYGPSLASHSAGTVWRGWVAALFVGIAIIVQLWYFFQGKYHGMAWLEFRFIIRICRCNLAAGRGCHRGVRRDLSPLLPHPCADCHFHCSSLCMDITQVTRLSGFLKK